MNASALEAGDLKGQSSRPTSLTVDPQNTGSPAASPAPASQPPVKSSVAAPIQPSSPDYAAFQVKNNPQLEQKQSLLIQRLGRVNDLPQAAAAVPGATCSWTNWVTISPTAQATQCMSNNKSLFALFIFSDPADNDSKNEVGRGLLASGKGNLVYVASSSGFAISISAQYLNSLQF